MTQMHATHFRFGCGVTELTESGALVCLRRPCNGIISARYAVTAFRPKYPGQDVICIFCNNPHRASPHSPIHPRTNETTTEGGRRISPQVAPQHVFAYGVGVDLTRRDMQRAAKKAGRPWDCSKGFDSSGPVGMLTPVAGEGAAAGTGDKNNAIWLKVDGALRQDSVLGEMVWSVPEMISRLSEVIFFCFCFFAKLYTC